MDLPLRGPHAGNELVLMLLGVKPCALVYEPNQFWREAVRRGLVIDAGILPGEKHGATLFVLAGHEHRADEVRAVYAEVEEMSRMTEEHHRRLGHLFGYSDEAVEFFLNNRL